MNEEEIIAMSKKHAENARITLNPDKIELDNIVKGLLRNKEKYGEIYCPCRLVTKNKDKDRDNICPCVFHRGEIELQGHCLCKLYFK